MTGFTGDRLLGFFAMVEQEGVLGELGRRPGHGGVAAVAAGPEQVHVHFGFCVAAGAVGGRAVIDMLAVAVGAGHVAVLSIQYIVGVVVEGHHAICAVMALHAVIAVVFEVFGHQVMLGFDMAGQAVHGLLDEAALLVAGFAVHRVTGVVFLVADQAVSRQLVVVHIGEGEGGDIGIAAHVLLVAGLALIGAGQPAVQAVCRGALAGDIHMAILAACIGDAVDGGVAMAAILLEFGMRDIACQLNTLIHTR